MATNEHYAVVPVEGKLDGDQGCEDDSNVGKIVGDSEVLYITEEGKCYKNGILVNDILEDSVLHPGERDDVVWCTVRTWKRKDKEIYGKWLVFKDYDQLSATWTDLVIALKDGRLEDCCKVKSSTLLYNPECAGPGPSTRGVIGVHTYEDDIESVGYKLIQIVKQDIKYKTEDDTYNYKYAHVGMIATIKTLYYNEGHPSTELVGERCFGTTRNKKDIWHVNEVINPKMSDHDFDYGRWILTLEYRELTDLWHLLKRKIECGQLKAWKMVCPRKQRQSSPDEKPVFHVYTSEENVRVVGALLIMEVGRDIIYEKKSGYPHYKTLYWNEGEYAYEKIRRKGITRNWRTGEAM